MQRDLARPGRVNTVLLSGAARPPDARLDTDLCGRGRAVTAAADGPGGPTLVVEGESGIVNEALDAATGRAAAAVGVRAVPVFTYLANAIRNGRSPDPVSLDHRDRIRPGCRSMRRGAVGRGARPIGIVLNGGRPESFGASPADAVEVEYYLWDAAAGLQAQSGQLPGRRAVVPSRALPPIAGWLPSIRASPQPNSLADWDPPFPVDLSRVRPVDEAYWRNTGRRRRRSSRTSAAGSCGDRGTASCTSLRFPLRPRRRLPRQPRPSALRCAASFPPAAMGLALLPVRDQAHRGLVGVDGFRRVLHLFQLLHRRSRAAAGGAVLQARHRAAAARDRHPAGVGLHDVARSAGCSSRRRSCWPSAAALLGVAGAMLYARLIVHGLRTWWIGAVGHDDADVHVSPAVARRRAPGGVVAALGVRPGSLRAVARLSPRALLARADAARPTTSGAERAGGLPRWPAPPRASGSSCWSPVRVAAGRRPARSSAPALRCWWRISRRLRPGCAARDRRALAGRGAWALSRLGFRSAACPAIAERAVGRADRVSGIHHRLDRCVPARRQRARDDPHSGTGGYALLAQSELPMLHDPEHRGGTRSAADRRPGARRAYAFTRFRLRPGRMRAA